MEKKNKKNALLSGAILAGALATFSITAVQARPATSQVLGNGNELRSEIIDLNVTSSPSNLFEMKCGSKTNTKTEKGKKAKKGKAVEGKCGSKGKKAAEAKCGTKGKKAEKKEAKKEAKKGKTNEGKCGQGKCGAA